MALAGIEGHDLAVLLKRLSSPCFSEAHRIREEDQKRPKEIA